MHYKKQLAAQVALLTQRTVAEKQSSDRLRLARKTFRQRHFEAAALDRLKAVATTPGQRDEALEQLRAELEGDATQFADRLRYIAAYGQLNNEVATAIRHAESGHARFMEVFSDRLGQWRVGNPQGTYHDFLEDFAKWLCSPAIVFTMHPTYRWVDRESREALNGLAAAILESAHNLGELLENLPETVVQFSRSKNSILDDQVTLMGYLGAYSDTVVLVLMPQIMDRICSVFGTGVDEIEAKVGRVVAETMAKLTTPVSWVPNDADGNDFVEKNLLVAGNLLYQQDNMVFLERQVDDILNGVRGLVSEAELDDDSLVVSLIQFKRRLLKTRIETIDALLGRTSQPADAGVMGRIPTGHPRLSEKNRAWLDAQRTTAQQSLDALGNHVEAFPSADALVKEMDMLDGKFLGRARESEPAVRKRYDNIIPRLTFLRARVTQTGLLGVRLQPRQEAKVLETAIAKLIMSWEHHRDDKKQTAFRKLGEQFANAKRREDRAKIFYDYIETNNLRIDEEDLRYFENGAEPHSAENQLLGWLLAIRDTIRSCPGVIERFNIAMCEGPHHMVALWALFRFVGITPEDRIRVCPLTETGVTHFVDRYAESLNTPLFREWLRGVDNELATFWAHSDLSRIIGLGASRLGIQAVHDALLEAVAKANQQIQNDPPVDVLKVYWSSIRRVLVQAKPAIGTFPVSASQMSEAQWHTVQESVKHVFKISDHPQRHALEMRLCLRVSFFEGNGGGVLRGETPDGSVGGLDGVAGQPHQRGVIQRTVQGERVAGVDYAAYVTQIVAQEVGSRVESHHAEAGYASFIREVYDVLDAAEAQYKSLIMDEGFWTAYSQWAEGFAAAGWGSRKANRGESPFRAILEVFGSEHASDTLTNRLPYHTTRAITAANMDYLSGFSPRLVGNVMLLKFLDQKLSEAKPGTRTYRMLAAVRSDILYRVKALLSLTHLTTFPMELRDSSFGDMIASTVSEVLTYFREQGIPFEVSRDEKRRQKWVTVVGLHKVALERAIRAAEEAHQIDRVNTLKDLRKWVVAASAGVVGRTG